MNYKTDATRLLWYVWWTFLATMLFALVPNCSKHHPHDPPVEAPPDTVVIVDSVFIHEHHDHPIGVACDTVDLTIEFTVIGDQSAPNVYAYYRNGVEVGRFIVTDTFPEPTDVTFQVIFERIIPGDVITIKKIEGSRAGIVGSTIVEIRCSASGTILWKR